MPLIEARAVRLAYGPRTILDDVTLTIGKGEFWFFLGNNGQGKSTLLHALLGVCPLAAGAIRTTATADRAHMGFVPQRCQPNPTLPTTVREFVELGMVGLNLSPDDRSGRVVEALGQVGLEPFARRSFWALSGGERQRVMVARALARRPALLLLDEPTNSLDYAVEVGLLNLLAECHRAGEITIVLVSHDVPLAARHATHVALFHQGRVQAGPRADILTPEAVRQTFGATIPGVFA